MRRTRRWALTALLVLATAPVPAAKIGLPAPPFKLTTFDGKEISLADLRGQVIVLNYWATWCGPCKAEMPAIDTYVRAHPGQGLSVFAVATEDSVPEHYLKPLARLLAFPLVRRISGTSGRYGIIGDAVPTSYVIDRAGVVRYAKAAAFDAQSLDAVIGPLLAEPAPATTAGTVTAAR